MVGRSLDALFPEGGGGDRRAGAPAPRASRAAASSRTSRSRCAAARSSASPASSARAAPRSRGAIFGIDRLDAGRLWIDGRRFTPALAARGAPPRARLPSRGPAAPGAHPADVDRAEHVDGGAARSSRRPGSCARGASGGSRAGSWSSSGSRPPRRPRSCAASRAATSRRSCSRSGSRRSRGCSSSTSRRTASTSGTKADVHRTISQPGRAGARDPAHLVGAARDPRDERPRARHPRGQARRRAPARGGDAGARSSRPRPASEDGCMNLAARTVSPHTLASAAFRLRELGIFIALARRDRLLRACARTTS